LRRLLRVRGLGGLVLLAAWLAVVPAVRPAEPADCIVLEDFGRARVGEFPADWRVRSDEGRPVYTVQEEGGRRFLRARSDGLGIQAARETEGWNLATHPVLTWSWRPREFPRGADERKPATNDSALAVYMAVDYSMTRGPKAVKYVWSQTVPAGTRLSSNQGLTHVLVLRSGPPPPKGAWVEQRVDVLRDWQAAFDESETPSPAGIVVLTDADDTRSTAAGDYASFRACRR
jgi:hypothetical protein